MPNHPLYRPADKQAARAMYAAGMTYAQIGLVLNAQKSTISYWCGDLARERQQKSMAETAKRKAMAKWHREERRLHRAMNRPVKAPKPPRPPKPQRECVWCEATFTGKRQTCSDSCLRALKAAIAEDRHGSRVR